jgi:hypothetical protein
MDIYVRHIHPKYSELHIQTNTVHLESGLLNLEERKSLAELLHSVADDLYDAKYEEDPD